MTCVLFSYMAKKLASRGLNGKQVSYVGRGPCIVIQIQRPYIEPCIYIEALHIGPLSIGPYIQGPHRALYIGGPYIGALYRALYIEALYIGPLYIELYTQRPYIGPLYIELYINMVSLYMALLYRGPIYWAPIQSTIYRAPIYEGLIYGDRIQISFCFYLCVYMSSPIYRTLYVQSSIYIHIYMFHTVIHLYVTEKFGGPAELALAFSDVAGQPLGRQQQNTSPPHRM